MKYLSARIRALPFFALLLTSGCLFSGILAGRERRFVFVDGGAHYGESTKVFMASGVYRDRNWELYAVEANPSKKVLAALKAIPGVRLINKAMWVYDGKIDLRLSENDSKNSLLPSAVAQPAGSAVVKCFDFSRWTRRNFSEGDLVVLSLDIQGAEYGVLGKMLEDGTAGLVDVLMVELHPDGDGAREAGGKELLERFRALGTAVLEDSADGVEPEVLEAAVGSRF